MIDSKSIMQRGGNYKRIIYDSVRCSFSIFVRKVTSIHVSFGLIFLIFQEISCFLWVSHDSVSLSKYVHRCIDKKVKIIKLKDINSTEIITFTSYIYTRYIVSIQAIPAHADIWTQVSQSSTDFSLVLLSFFNFCFLP